MTQVLVDLFNFVKKYDMYPAELVKPMKEDLTKVGFEELLDAAAVDAAV